MLVMSETIGHLKAVILIAGSATQRLQLSSCHSSQSNVGMARTQWQKGREPWAWPLYTRGRSVVHGLKANVSWAGCISIRVASDVHCQVDELGRERERKRNEAFGSPTPSPASGVPHEFVYTIGALSPGYFPYKPGLLLQKEAAFFFFLS